MALDIGYGAQEDAMQAYFREGLERAMALPNRGQLRFAKDGKLHPDIMAAYDEYGFYVLDDVVSPAELAELEAAYLDMIDRLPVAPGAEFDKHGRPALGADLDLTVAHWSRPLSDPSGGTDKIEGRAPVKMFEPTPADGTPEQVVCTITGPLQFSDPYLRLSGHPDILRVVASINGDDFTPFQEGVIIKRPGEGISFSWHQDGTTHWNHPDWNPHIHGINLMTQLYSSTPANGVWFVPGTHKAGKVNIPAMVERAGSERLPDAVPLVCGPGAMAISNRQILHGSFANTSPDIRVTLGLGFHRRSSLLGVEGLRTGAPGRMTLDAALIAKRCAMIGYAIDARRRHFPDEEPFQYQPHIEAGEVYRWDDAARKAARDYQKSDLRI